MPVHPTNNKEHTTASLRGNIGRIFPSTPLKKSAQHIISTSTAHHQQSLPDQTLTQKSVPRHEHKPDDRPVTNRSKRENTNARKQDSSPVQRQSRSRRQYHIRPEAVLIKKDLHSRNVITDAGRSHSPRKRPRVEVATKEAFHRKVSR